MSPPYAYARLFLSLPPSGVLGTERVLSVLRQCDMSKRKLDEDHHAPTRRAPGHWAMGLMSAMNDPNLQVKKDERVVVIKDKYPKAEFHYLVLPHEKIACLKNVTEEHCELLQHMHDVGMELAQKHPKHTFRLGYHAEPSMHHLHLHVISDDFNSPSLKTKKHWNSFTTDHFILSTKVLSSLKETGKPPSVSPEKCKNLLNAPLQCHKCSFKSPTIPKLKEHLLTHS